MDLISSYVCFGRVLGSSDGKETSCNAEDPGSIPGTGTSPGDGNGNPLQCSCQGNLMDRGVWWAIVHGIIKESDRTEQLNNNA